MGSKKTKIQDKLNIIFFAGILFIGAVLFFVLPKNEISENEKRKLTTFPQFSIEKYFTGKYTDSIDLYYADNFSFRNYFLGLASNLKDKYGIHNTEVAVYQATGTLPELVDEIILEDDTTEENLIEVKDTTTTKDTIAVTDTTKPSEGVVIGGHGNGKIKAYDRSIYVYKNKAFQLYGGSQHTMNNYAGLVNLYQTILAPETKVYCLSIPKLSKYFLPKKYFANCEKEKKNIDYLYSKLLNGATGIKAYQKHQQHQGEYLYFNTDHHWTGLGAYYAYQAFCESAGFTPYKLDQFKQKLIKPFLGTLYHITLSSELKKNADSVIYYVFPVKTTAKIIKTGNDAKKGTPSKLLIEYARGPNSYSVFLGGDVPLIKITSSVKTNRKVLIIKDSNGNAFAPFLVLHFSEVYVADYRYYKANVVDLIRENKITDVIFAHSSLVMNRKYTIQRERTMLGKYRFQTPKDTISTAKKTIIKDTAIHK